MKNVSPIMKRHRLFTMIFGILFIVVLAMILYFININYLSGFSGRELYKLRKKFAIAGAILFVCSDLLFCTRVFLKYTSVKGFEKFLNKININSSVNSKRVLEGDLILSLRTIVKFLGKIFQNLHVIVSFLGATVIALHVYIALYMNINFTAGYILGYITLVLLILLLITSITRIMNKNIKSHKWLGIWMLVFMGLHLLLVKP